MTPDAAYELIKICLTEGFLIVTPIVGIALIVGISVSLLQSITSIQEQTLSFVPKLFVAGGVVWMMSPRILERLSSLVILLFQRSGEVLR